MLEDKFILTNKADCLLEKMYEVVAKFDRRYKHTLGTDMIQKTIELLEETIAIKKRVYKKTDLTKADIAIGSIKRMIYISYDFRLISKSEQKEILDLVVECGKIIGSMIEKEMTVIRKKIMP